MTTSKEQGGAIFVRGLDEDEPGEHGDEAESDEDDESCDADCPLSREGKQGEQGHSAARSRSLSPSHTRDSQRPGAEFRTPESEAGGADSGPVSLLPPVPDEQVPAHLDDVRKEGKLLTSPVLVGWADNDQYSHANNVVYSLYFDSITNFYLINHVPRPTPTSPPPLGLIVSSSTAYASSVAYPSPVIAALGVSSLGKSSVTWRVALFEGEYVDPASSSSSSAASEETSSLAGWTLQDVMSGNGGVGRQVRLKSSGGEPPRAAAYGDMVHVFVDPESRRPLPDGMDPALRAALQKLQVKQ
ncbi:hypothetical protein C6P46_006193 [Rhodotorula mucilaginosa]|uniref:Thioesterase domain-containing protein n=1 Tax=Rhodotorula mucilaginosa TaxID=5537 RepID=A0A9P6VYN3_RHOMI|nr:hypothetical protein C6P46_006193 [Rhodotorula mucilaginosa]